MYPAVSNAHLKTLRIKFLFKNKKATDRIDLKIDLNCQRLQQYWYTQLTYTTLTWRWNYKATLNHSVVRWIKFSLSRLISIKWYIPTTFFFSHNKCFAFITRIFNCIFFIFIARQQIATVGTIALIRYPIITRDSSSS